METNYKALRDRLSPERRAANEAAAKEMLAEMPVHALGDALRLTQQQLAEGLGVKQGTISKMERRPDHLVSTLRRFVEAMGGELDLPLGLAEQLRIAPTERTCRCANLRNSRRNASHAYRYLPPYRKRG